MPDAALRLRCWDGECVLFHGASGDTHRIARVVGDLLERLMLESASTAALSEAVDLHQDDVVRALGELAQLGLVESFRCA